ncbi:GNAT family N-acetyltransferase [Steroidobacter sp.]|uniref:GNAT family N-acetyltransferase n=1 Tax=Steroidobacter sp. TaxID=1978227 RepID=UPI001A4009E3|nr:GNAT family N-acetyltransferase [Steroidobacter sp.]MBL8268281.1 GNAT family N-acetyltransferase [Steroidobacter sp.]
MHVFPVETARLQMRPLTAGDAWLYQHLYSDADTMRFIGTPLSPEHAAKSFQSALAGMQRRPIERLFLTVTEKATRSDVGICSLQNFDEQQRCVQAGVMFVASARAQGYSKESFIGLIQQVFVELPVDELWVQFAVNHVAVQRAVLSVGFARRQDSARQEGSRQGSAPSHATNHPPSAAIDGQPTAWAVRRESWSPSALRNAQ